VHVAAVEAAQNPIGDAGGQPIAGPVGEHEPTTGGEHARHFRQRPFRLGVMVER